MLVKIRPYTSEEAKRISSGIVTDTTTGTPYSVNSKETFGNQEQPTDPETKKRSCDIYTKTGIIMLDMPVPNFFLCGKRLELLTKIMPKEYIRRYSTQDCSMTSIINCTVVYDVQYGTFVDVNKTQVTSNIYDSSRYELGGQAIKRLIDEFDVNTEVKHEILERGIGFISSAFNKVYQSRLKQSEKEHIKVLVGEVTDFHVIDDYYLDLSGLERNLKDRDFIEDKKDIFRCKEFKDAYENILYNELFTKMYNNRITYLLALKNDPVARESFKNLVQDFMIVMPVGERPDSDMGINLISNAYIKVVKANNSLRSIRHQKNQTVNNVINSYKELVKAYRYVTVDYEAIRSKKNSEQSYRDIVSTLKGKEGKIRGKLQSVPFDNSGRTVIIVDPDMSIDSIGVPYVMLRELLDAHYVAMLPKELTPKEKLKMLDKFKSDANLEKTKAWIDAYVKNIPVVPGRQPTLWKFGIQAMKAVPVEGSAIKLSPLQVSAYNADFDGDQMHINVPLSPEAVQEVLNNVMNIKNIYLSRDGSCHMYPRHEIIYGLWLASKAKPTGPVIKTADKLNATLIEFIKDAIINDTYPLDSSMVVNGETYSLGQLAVKTCAGVNYADYAIGTSELIKTNKLSSSKSTAEVKDVEDGIFTEDWSIKLLTKIYDSVNGQDLFIKTINNYTKIGTSIATYYPPNVSITKLPDISKYIKEFNESIKKSKHLYDIGIETEVGYRNQYTRAYAKLKKDTEFSILNPKGDNYIGDNNGFKLMADSKCRGNKSTLMQMFGLKGRVMKNSNEAFNSIITHSMAQGLTGLEGLITAYGGRQGQIDKSIETAKPGYISRTMDVASAGMVIRDLDCGTTKGINLTYDRLRFYLAKPHVEEKVVYAEIRNRFEAMVVGRYLLEKPDSPVEKRDVNSLFKTFIADIDKQGNLIKKNGCNLRSSHYCLTPCCQKCYGIDPATHAKVKKGRAITFEAAQSIGQPGTQLTMKNFQSGGVVGEANLTSSFELMQKYLGLTDLNSGVKTGRPIKTDILSPIDAEVKEVYVGRNLKQIFLYNPVTNKIINGEKPIVMFAGIKTKKFVKAGEGIQEDLGDLSPDNVLECKGVEELTFYVMMKLYEIFNREVSVDFKHFETIVATMIFFACKKKVGKFKAGLQYTLIEYMRDGGYKTPENFVKLLIGIKSVPDASKDCMRSIIFEDLLDAVRKHILTSYTDEVKDPWVRLSLGLMPNIGSMSEIGGS